MQTLAKSNHCALARANPVFGTDKKPSVPKTRLLIKAITAWVCFYTRSSIACGWLFIRAQSTIRADGFSSAQFCNSALSGRLQSAM
jgi:hypothetical protein